MPPATRHSEVTNTEATSDHLVGSGPELKLSWGTQTLPRLIKKQGVPLITNSAKSSSFICFFLVVKSEIHYKCHCSKAYINVMADFVRALRSLYLTEDERNVMKCICLFTPGKNMKVKYAYKTLERNT